MIRKREPVEAVTEEDVFGPRTVPGKSGRGRRILVVSRDPVAREFLAMICAENGFLVDEAEDAPDAAPHGHASPTFACRVGLRPFFSRCAALLRELGTTRIETLMLVVGEERGKGPAELESTEAVTVLVRPFEDEAIVRILKDLMAPHGGQLV